MFSQSVIDSMSVTELTELVGRIAREVDSRIDDPQDALDYCNALINLAGSLQERIEEVLED